MRRDGCDGGGLEGAPAPRRGALAAGVRPPDPHPRPGHGRGHGRDAGARRLAVLLDLAERRPGTGGAVAGPHDGAVRRGGAVPRAGDRPVAAGSSRHGRRELRAAGARVRRHVPGARRAAAVPGGVLGARALEGVLRRPELDRPDDRAERRGARGGQRQAGHHRRRRRVPVRRSRRAAPPLRRRRVDARVGGAPVRGRIVRARPSSRPRHPIVP